MSELKSGHTFSDKKKWQASWPPKLESVYRTVRLVLLKPYGRLSFEDPFSAVSTKRLREYRGSSTAKTRCSKRARALRIPKLEHSQTLHAEEVIWMLSDGPAVVSSRQEEVLRDALRMFLEAHGSANPVFP